MEFDRSPASTRSSRMSSSVSSVTSSPSSQRISGAALKRLQKEFKSFVTSPPPGLELDDDTVSGNVEMLSYCETPCTIL